MTSEHSPNTESGLAAEDLARVLRDYMTATDRLQRTHEALQGEVLRLRQELASKDRELELRRRLAALGELAAGVAHEVRNPLGAIQLYSGLLRTECRAHKLEPALELLEKIEAGIHAIDAVVQDTLALAPRDRRVGVCRVRDVLQRARDASLQVLTAQHVDLDLAAVEPDVCVRADPNGLQRVLVNLIANAAEASPAGTVVRVELARADASTVGVRVLDHGSGLADEVLHRVFDPFFTTKRNGTGLGLTIAHRLIEAYGGRLTAGNRPEGGAELVVTLPRAEASEAQAGQRPDAQEHSAA